jgi:HD superfamily phosphohydrolase YqeK
LARSSLLRYLPQVLLATFTVAVGPAVVLLACQLSGWLRSPAISILLGVVLSSVLASAGSAIWMRRPGSRDLVFGDLLLWGFIRRVRTERRLVDATRLLRVDDARGRRSTLAPERQAEALRRLASSLEARDPYTHGHTRRVTRHSEMIAKKMGLSPTVVAKIRSAAAVHDVGKLLTPREILNKPGKLTDEEFAVMKRHAADSAEMAAGIGDEEITAIIRHHHERLDGNGYPDGLRGSGIPLGSRIIAVADTFDAMTSSRSYRSARKHKEAIEILDKEGDTQLDRKAVEAFISYYQGRRSIRWWGFLVTAPQRFVELVGVAANSAGGASIAQGVATVAAAAVLGSSVAADSDARQGDRAVPGHRAVEMTASQVRAVANGRTGRDRSLRDSDRRRTRDRPGPARTRPGSTRPGEGAREMAPGDSTPAQGIEPGAATGNEGAATVGNEPNSGGQHDGGTDSRQPPHKPDPTMRPSPSTPERRSPPATQVPSAGGGGQHDGRTPDSPAPSPPAAPAPPKDPKAGKANGPQAP